MHKDMKVFQKVKGYGLVNEAKYRRANSIAKGDEDQILIHYDKFGGLIIKIDEKGIRKIANGSFWNFNTGQPILGMKDKKETVVKEAVKEVVKEVVEKVKEVVSDTEKVIKK